MKKLTLLLLGLMGLVTFKGEARLDPVSHAMFSNPGYAKHIEVQCYFVTREQLAKVFVNENEIVVQKTNKDLYHQGLFLLVRCRNRGEYVAAGTLNCCPPSFGSFIPIEVVRMQPMNATYHDCVIYIGSAIGFSNDELPKIKYEWDCLYTM
ncbi:MAG: hypothetical protein AB7N99_01340 [Simkaniaceae bacterium]